MSRPSGRAIACITSAQSSAWRRTARADPASTTTPWRRGDCTRPNVGRKPTTPHRPAGLRIDPLVSLPMAKATQPAAVADDGPADDPLEPCVGSHGLLVCPPNQLSPAASSPRRQLGDQHGAGVAQHLDDARRSRALLGEGRRAPRGLEALHGDDVLHAPRDAVQRPLVASGGDLPVGLGRLRHSVVVEERHDVVQRGVAAVQPRQVHPRQLRGRHLLRADELGQVP